MKIEVSKKNLQILLALPFFAIVALGTSSLKESFSNRLDVSNPISTSAELFADWPTSTSPIADVTAITCTGLLNTSIYGQSSDAYGGEASIYGNLEMGQDKLAVSIEGEMLYMSTEADLSVGRAKSEKWLLVQNEDDKAVAFWFNENASSLFTLNKNNGLAVWSKNYADFFGRSTPYGQVIYLSCN